MTRGGHDRTVKERWSGHDRRVAFSRSSNATRRIIMKTKTNDRTPIIMFAAAGLLAACAIRVNLYGLPFIRSPAAFRGT